MKIISWNVQNGLDAYGENKRVEQYNYLSQHEADVIALQEVDEAYFFGLENGLNNYDWHFCAALTYYDNGQVKQFGNAIGARKGTTVQWRSHCLLPAPTDAPQHMPRSVGEIVVKIEDKLIRVLTCHLEFYCENQRKYQIQQINQIVEAACVLRDSPSRATEGLYKPLPLPVEAIICGDFNFPDDSTEYREHFEITQLWFDLAPLDIKPTCGVFDTQQWPKGADRRDFFFTNNAELRAKMWSDIETSLSDHQPIFLQN
jgi:endonuclease/exonuclease/phosphatase family metal-dependent hydrolase